MSRVLPDFDNPPVVETVLDVGFSPLQGWGIPHFGLFWNLIRAEYPKFEDRPPMRTEIETFGTEPKRSASASLEILETPEARCWFVNAVDARLLQVQNDHFIHNWRKMKAGQSYPHYEEAIRPAFKSEWSRFLQFLESESLPLPDVRQCEVAYINHVELAGWQTFEDLVDGLKGWPRCGDRGGFLPEPENVAIGSNYLLPNNAGRLRVTLQPAIRNADAKPIVQLNMSVRGKPASSDMEEILKWFDLGREWIVRGFVDFTSDKMHKIWQRRV